MLRTPAAALAVVLLLPTLAAADNGREEDAPGNPAPEGEAGARAAERREAVQQRARAVFEQGVAHMRAGDWEAAETRFRRSFGLHPTQAALFNLGSAQLAQGRAADALTTFDRYLDEFAEVATRAQRDEVQRLRRRALAGLCEVALDVSPEGAEILVDGEPVGTVPLVRPLVLEAGEHRLAARLDGYETREVSRAFEGGCGRVALALSLRASPRGQDGRRDLLLAVPRPRTEPDPTRTAAARAGWALLATAAATGIAATVTGGLALSLRQEFSQMSMLDDDWRPVQREGRALALGTDILLGLTAAAAAVCIPLLVYGHGARAATR